ncbi:MAG: hypothetical protein KDH94_05220, partial [Coxiellaceae bacterium]|nr:hypothetical protein [Coxiellaceae bacterium]
MKKSLSLVTLIVALLLPFSTPAATIKWGSPTYIESLDPHATFDPSAVIFNMQVYEPLMRLTTEEITPILAASYKQVDDKTYVFTLRENITFHEGEPLTADDVVYSIQRAKKGFFENMFKTVADVKALDKLTVQVSLSAPDPVFLRKLSFLGIMSASWIKKHKSEQVNMSGQIKNPNYAHTHQNDTGPYKLLSRDAGVKTVAVRYDNYWDKANVTSNIDRIEVFPIVNNATRTSALISGEINFNTYVPPQDYTEVSSTQGIKLMRVPPYSTFIMSFNTTAKELADSNIKGKNPLADKRVRQAIQLAIPMDLIIDKLLQPENAIAAGLFVPPSVHGFNKTLNEREPYNIEKAKQLMTEAGYPNGFTAGFPCVTTIEVICNIASASMAKIGIQATVEPMPINKAMSKIREGKADFGLGLYFFTTFDVGMGLEDIYHSNGYRNYHLYSNPTLDKIIEAQSVELDVAKRLELINQALTIIKEDKPDAPLYFPIFYIGMKDNV